MPRCEARRSRGASASGQYPHWITKPSTRTPCTDTTISTNASWTSACGSSATRPTRYLPGELTEDEFRPLRLHNGLYIQRHAPMLRVAIPYGLLSSAPAAHAGPHRAQLRPRLRPLHHAPEHPVQLAAARGGARHPGRSGRASRCTPSRPAATASATSPPTISPASRRDEIDDPRPLASSSASGPPSTRNSPTCRASSRSRSAARRPTARRRACTTSACALRSDAGEHGFEVLVGGGLGRTPIIGHVIRGSCRGGTCCLPRGHPARVQPLRPARQHVQGAHQDPGEGAGRGGVPRRGRGGVGSTCRTARHGARSGIRARRASSRRRPTATLAGRAPTRCSPWRRTNRGSPLGAAQRRAAPRARLRHRGAVAQAHRHAARRRDRRDRWTRSPTWPTATASARCASRHEQNLVLADVAQAGPADAVAGAGGAGPRHANIGLLTNIICCPGGDYCSLANARSIPVAEAIQQRFDDSTTCTTSATSTSTSPAA